MELTKVAPFCFSLGAFAFYVLFLAPTLSTPDSPELVAAAFTLGVAHPPGYSLYLLVGKLFSFLPLGSLAWRLNLMSAVFASLTVGLVYLAIWQLWELTRAPSASPHTDPDWLSRPMAFVATLILAISPIFWIFALRAEVYPANAFLMILGVLSFLNWRIALRSLSLVSFLCGLLLAFHTANLVYFGAFAFLGVVLLLRDGKLRPLWLTSTFMFSFFLVGFSVVLYLPVRSASLPLVTFGEIAGLKGFYQTLSGKVYLEELPYFAIPWTERLYNMRYAFSHVNEEFGSFLALLGAIGLGLLGRRAPFFALFLLPLIVAHVAFWGSSDLGASTRSFFPAHMFMNVYVLYTLFIGIGGLGLLRWLKNRGPLFSRFRIVIPLLVFLFPAYSFVKSQGDSDKYQDNQDLLYRYYEQGYEGLRSLENPSTFLCSNGNNGLFFFWYFATAEGKWPGVKVVIMDPFFKTPLERILKDPDNWEILERLKGKTFDNKRDLRSAILGELVRVNDGKLPVYMNISYDYVPSGYAKIQKGGIYEVRKGIDIQELIVERPRMDHFVGVKYGDALELVGYDLDRAALKQGSKFRIIYFWRALRALSADYQIMVLITDENGEIVSEPFSRSLAHVPVYGAFPSSHWPANQVIQEKCELFSPGGLKAGQYQINVAAGNDKELLPVTESKVPVKERFAQIGHFEVLP